MEQIVVKRGLVVKYQIQCLSTVSTDTEATEWRIEIAIVLKEHFPVARRN